MYHTQDSSAQPKLGYPGASFRHHYFITTSAPLSDEESARLQAMLGEVAPLGSLSSEAPAVLVMPRVGTLSPWSSKATDIAKVCGFEKVTRIERGVGYEFEQALSESEWQQAAARLHDRMTESVVRDFRAIEASFAQPDPVSRTVVDILGGGLAALEVINQQHGLALTAEDRQYLLEQYQALGRNPTLTELMMFGQVNSEHCRHKLFNASWSVDGEAKANSLFSMIKNTYQHSNRGVLSAYHDNGAVIEGHPVVAWFVDPHSQRYTAEQDALHTVIKVETHNHPTAISPYAGAATGAGGEIRDEGATGIGARPKAGLCGFCVSNLAIPGFVQPWEVPYGKPDHIASALDIMLEGPIGAASFNNEFGRPNLCGYFRSFEQAVEGQVRGYHKPIMIAGGLGNIRVNHIKKRRIAPTMPLVVLGGPAMQIGLGGGAASSMHSGQSDASLDFASVQRANPEMQRRCQQVINACVARGADNPIVSIHDVGAGGLCNAMPELVNDSDCGGRFRLRDIPNAEPGMSPMAVWCNEAQERYVLAIAPEQMATFKRIAQRERCPFGVIGEATGDGTCYLEDAQFEETVIDLPMSVLFHKAPKLHRNAQSRQKNPSNFDVQSVDLKESLCRVLRHPTVASKQFLITIGDRSVTGLVARDQMVGPWQVPVADVAVTASSYRADVGEAMSMGERSPVALLDPKAAARLAISEAITNILAADVQALSDIKLSANWMAAAGDAKEEADLYAAVQTVGEELCPALDITVPVGKDSLSMRMCWQEGEQGKSVTSPLSLVISAFAPINDVRATLTPELSTQVPSECWLIDLGAGQNRLGGSILAQVYGQLGANAPDLAEAASLQSLLAVLQDLRATSKLYAYHDRSDGGVLVTLCEMAFASHCGLDIVFDDEPIRAGFAEELGVVVQIAPEVAYILERCDLPCRKIATLNDQDQIAIYHQGSQVFCESRRALQRVWSETSYRLQALRDNPACAQEEFDAIQADTQARLFADVRFEIKPDAAPAVGGAKPKVAILREQGVNGHMEMAAAFDVAGFECIDVHMSDIIEGRIGLEDFQGLAACGGFSYGDVLGAGRGWANAVLYHARARDQFEQFFHRQDTFTLGVCNGCQMLSHLKHLIPGADHFPTFARNHSNQFEARLTMVRIEPSASILFQGMEGAELPIAVAHGEGRLKHQAPEQLLANQHVSLRYLEQRYPNNPNGSAHGITGVCSQDGRVNIMMPHPERVFKTSQFSWHPENWSEYAPWLRLFQNAFEFV